MGGLCEERFGGSGRGVENESEGWGSGDGWWRLLMKKKGKQKSMTGIGASLTPN